jgi:predicted phage terminase large subunit-like protein
MYAPPTLAEIERELERRKLLGSLEAFAQAAWHVVEPSTELVWNWHLSALAQHLEAVTAGQLRRLVINIPPGTMKSLMSSVFWPAWVWAKTPEWRGLFCSYGADLAIRDSVKCRGLIESDWYQEMFVKGAWHLAGDQNVKSYYVNSRTGFRISLSVGGKTTGFRGDAIVIDDPLNALEVYSKAARDECRRWYDQALSSRLNDLRTGAIVLIMQRLHEEDLTAHLLKKGGWEHLCLPSEYEPERASRTSIGWKDPRTAAGELLFPQRFPREVLDAAAVDLGSAGYAGQHQQRPAPAEGGMFKRTWWRFWRHAWEDDVADHPELGDLRARTVVLPEKFDRMALSWDCAFKGTKESDFVAGGAWGSVGADKFLVDLVWDQLTFTKTVAELRAQVKRYPQATAKLVEEKANGAAVIDTLQKEITGIIAVDPEGGKEARAAATTPQVEAGNVYIPLHAKWRDKYIEEHAVFPKAAHDDAVDQQSQILLRWKTNAPPSFSGIPERTRPILPRRM